MSLPDLFSSGSVSDGDPDKLADRISNMVQDRCLTLDRDACETLLAGDQGVMFGCACDGTPGLKPLPIQVARRLMQLRRCVSSGRDERSST